MEREIRRDATNRSFPNSVAEITPEWLTDALRESGALQVGRVTSAKRAPLGGGVGLMSHMSRLLLSYDVDVPDAPETLIAKLPPEDAGSHRRGIELGFFEGEAGFYGVLSDRSAIRAPICYFAQFDSATGNFLMLLEDLSAARLGDVNAGCTSEEAAVAVTTLARFHASWWNESALADYAWLQKLTDRIESFFPLLPEAWPTFEARFRPRLAAGEFNLLLQTNEELSGSNRVLPEQSQTLLHGDFKLDNIFFLPSGEIVACDWGLVMTGSAMFDVASFLSLNLPIEHRQQLEADLIHLYVRTLAAAGAAAYDYDTALADYRRQLVGFLPRLIVAGGLAQFVDDDALDEYALGLRRLVSAVTDHGGLDNRPWV